MNLASIVVLCIVAGLLILSIVYSRKKRNKQMQWKLRLLWGESYR